MERLKEIRERAAKKWRENHPEEYKRQNLYNQKKYYERVKYDEEFKAKRKEYARQYREKKGIKPRKKKVIPVVICKGPIKISFD